VQQIIFYAQIQLHHVAVQEAEQSLIVQHVHPIPMVCADIQLVVVILVGKRMIMVLPVHPVAHVSMAPVPESPR